MEPVAVLGLGRMGSAMARRLSAAGHPLTLWNRSSDKATTLAGELGGNVASTPAEAARGVRFVLASLADDEALLAVHTGPGGTLEGVAEGTVVIDTSTVSPGAAQQVASLLSGRGAWLLDAPVSGSTALVDRGEVTTMVGGNTAAMEEARPVIEAYSQRVFHLGPNGTGATMKLAVNSFVHSINQALSESLVLAESAGIERDVAYDVFASGAGGAPFVHYKRQSFLEPDTAPIAFTLDLVRKDLDLILALAESAGVPMPAAETTGRMVTAAQEAGLGETDMSAVAEYLRSRNT